MGEFTFCPIKNSGHDHDHDQNVRLPPFDIDPHTIRMKREFSSKIIVAHRGLDVLMIMARASTNLLYKKKLSMS